MGIAATRRRRTGDTAILGALAARAWIAGRDGAISQTGATGGSFICPWTGATIAAGGICSAYVGVPGIGTLRLFHAQGARTNRAHFATDIGTSPANVTMSTAGAYRRMTVDTANAIHRVAGSMDAAAIGTATVVRFSFVLGGSVPYLYINFNAAIGMACAVRTSDGVIVASPTGTWSSYVVNGICTVVGSIVSTATNTNFFIQCNATGVATDSTYTGNGTDYVDMASISVESATFPGLVTLTNGSAVTRTADNIVWTPPSALSTTTGEVYAFEVPYLWNSNAGAQHPNGANAYMVRSITASNSSLLKDTLEDKAIKADAGTQVAATSAIAQSSGTLRMFSQKYDATALRLYRGDTLAATDSTLSAPWGGVSAFYIGSQFTPADHWFGAVGAIYDPAPTDATRAALARALNGRIVQVLA